MGNQVPDNCEVHTHIILGTTISKEHIEYYIQTTFRNPDIFIEDITKRDDKMNYANYLVKQKHLLTDDNYNYKIKLVGVNPSINPSCRISNRYIPSCDTCSIIIICLSPIASSSNISLSCI